MSKRKRMTVSDAEPRPEKKWTPTEVDPKLWVDNSGEGDAFVGVDSPSLSENERQGIAYSEDERQRIEGYFAERWDISLPENHPYRNNPPASMGPGYSLETICRRRPDDTFYTDVIVRDEHGSLVCTRSVDSIDPSEVAEVEAILARRYEISILEDNCHSPRSTFSFETIQEGQYGNFYSVNLINDTTREVVDSLDLGQLDPTRMTNDIASAQLQLANRHGVDLPEDHMYRSEQRPVGMSGPAFQFESTPNSRDNTFERIYQQAMASERMDFSIRMVDPDNLPENPQRGDTVVVRSGDGSGDMRVWTGERWLSVGV